MEEKKKPGVVIATRNRIEQLRHGLASLERYQAGTADFLVLDDGSDDGSRGVINEWVGDMTRGRTFGTISPGPYRRNPSYVFNTGHRLLKNDVIIEQGGEVVHLNDCITPLAAACKPGVVAIARVFNGTPENAEWIRTLLAAGALDFPPDAEVDRPETNGDKWRVPKLPVGFGSSHVELYTGYERMAPFLFLGAIHREDFESVGGYNENLPNRNDEDLANRLIARGGIVFKFLGNAVAIHLKHPKR